jgi:pimeloyl-ACP methyl ester carboxylesterase
MPVPAGKKTVILVRGLLGMIWSRGMDRLAATLAADGHKTQVWNHSPFFLFWFANKGAIAAEIDRLVAAGQTVILVGHSFGGSVVLMALRACKSNVAALFAVDPARQYDTTVPKNVKAAFGFRNVVGGLGMGMLAPKSDPRITDIALKQSHTFIDDDPAVHSRIIAEIMKI